MKTAITNKYARSIILAGGLVIVLAGLYYACLWGGASVANFVVQHRMESWLSGESIPDRMQWKSTEETMALALKLEPNNADYQSNMGKIYLYKADYLAVETLQIEAFMQNSLKHFYKAAQLRPAWPNAWANIALVTSRVNKLDQKFYQAFDHAVAFGAAVPNVQYTLSVATFLHWEILPELYRLKAITNAVYGLSSRRRNEILAVLMRYHVLDIVCVAPHFPVEFIGYCKQ